MYSIRMISFYERKRGGISEPNIEEVLDIPEDRLINVMGKELFAEMLSKGEATKKLFNMYFIYQLIKE